ncbi:BA75_02082T0 [Komagataella pastoris]|uniref:BA75_02082T0 n=1 Tax=Komagataella pastoris TaxID=4922 RepID=A0A1B2JC51_PICPA|nr:BA75_02082T0 [Komagataella pastoris]
MDGYYYQPPMVQQYGYVPTQPVYYMGPQGYYSQFLPPIPGSQQEQQFYNAGQPNQATNLTNKKDKKRLQIQNKLIKMEEKFQEEKDFIYRSNLHDLQYERSTLHADVNEAYLTEIRDLQEIRDEELVRLRLWEDYQVSCVTRQFNEGYEKANKEYDRLVTIFKTKLKERIEHKIKQLKEDKVLMDFSNHLPKTNTRSHNNVNGGLFGLTPGNISDREVNSNNGYYSSTDRRSRRRKFDHTTDNAEDSYDSNDNTSGSASNISRRSKMKKTGGNTSARSSSDTDDTFLTDDHALKLLFGSDYEKPKEKPSTRHSSKSFNGVSSLKPEELNEDLEILRSAIHTISHTKKMASK